MFSSPQHSPAMVLIPGQVKVLDHEGDVSVPGLVQAQDTHSELEIRFWAKGFYYPTVLPCIWRIHGDERLDLPGHYLFCPSHCESNKSEILDLQYNDNVYGTLVQNERENDDHKWNFYRSSRSSLKVDITADWLAHWDRVEQ